MGFGTVAVCTIGLLAMLSTSAVGQLPGIPPSGRSSSSNFMLPLIESILAGIEQGALRKRQSNTPQNSPSLGQSQGLNSYSPPPNTPQLFSPNTQPGSFNSFSPQLNIPPNNPFNNPPASFNPFSSQLNIPQQYPSVAQPGDIIPQLSLQPNYPSSALPGSLNPYSPSLNPPNINAPQYFPSNTQLVGLNPYNSPPDSQQSQTYNTQPAGFNSYNPPSDTQQQYVSGNPPASSNAPNPPPSTQQQSTPVSQPGGFSSDSIPPQQQTGTSSADSTPSNSDQTPSSSGQQSGTDSKSSYSQQISSSSSSGGGSTRSTSVHRVSSSHSSKQGHAGHAAGQHPHPPSPPVDEDPLKGHRIVCIFNNQHFYKGGFTPSEIEPHLCTHINYEFAFLDPKTYEVVTGDPALDIQMDFYKKLIELKKVNDKLKIILSVGGWTDSTKKYSEMAADEDKRKAFVQSCVSYIQKHEFDGMDLAWEYPNCWQGAIGINPKDKDNYILLLKDLNLELKKNGLIFSASVGAIKREMEAAYDIPAMNGLVDYLNVMTYDMHGPWESVTGHHMQFDKMPGDSDPYCNVKAAMDLWYQKGADKKNLNLGVAFYGRTYTLDDPDNHGMGAPARGVGDPGPDTDEGGLLLYREICQFMNSGNWTEEEDKKAGFYAYSGDQWACYDNPMMLVKKAKYVVDAQYGGILIKYMSGDDFKGNCFSMTFPLLKMCRLEMAQRIKKASRHHG